MGKPEEESKPEEKTKPEEQNKPEEQPKPDEKPESEEQPKPEEKPQPEEQPKPEKNNKAVCPVFDKWKCTQEKAYECSKGYYPVCGDVVKGHKFYYVKTEEECIAKCDSNVNDFILLFKNRKCYGYGWFSKYGRCN